MCNVLTQEKFSCTTIQYEFSYNHILRSKLMIKRGRMGQIMYV